MVMLPESPLLDVKISSVEIVSAASRVTFPPATAVPVCAIADATIDPPVVPPGAIAV